MACQKNDKNHFINSMAKEIDDIEIPENEDLEGLDDTTDFRAKASELQKKHLEAGIRNREKTKILRDRIAELEESDKKKVEKKSDEDLLKRLDTMALRVSGIQAEDEVELFNKWKEQTGRDADAIIGNPIFQKELADARTAKANAAATNIQGGGSASSAKGTLEEQADYWISKSSKDSRGDPLFSDEMPSDYKLHAAIVRKLNESSKDKKKFYNS
mgnify:CR=1 FL=1